MDAGRRAARRGVDVALRAVRHRGASDGARHAAARAEEALVSEREARCEAEVLQRRSDGACRRASERCEALEAEVASLRVRLEETARASSDLREAETAARASDE